MEFHISVGSADPTDSVVGRDAAVQRAKELSAGERGLVRVVRDDQRCLMVFRAGQLVEYQYEKYGRRR